MKKFIFLVFVFACIYAGSVYASAQACSAWNQFAASYHFDTYPQPSGTTFYEAYNGNNFSSDFAAILARVGQQINSTNPGIVGDDTLNATLEGWQSGTTKSN
jgi:curli biogenesis system outer membrane secretion channel CsgG